MRREHNLYFAALSPRQSLHLISAGLLVLLRGNRGPARWAERVERAWEVRYGGGHAVAVPSGRVGLAMLLRALGVEPGDEVIVTGYTCSAVPVAVMAAGARPVYADIETAGYGIDPAKVEALVSPRTRALLVQHTFGFSAAMDQLSATARAHGILLIEDACLAVGSAAAGRSLGTTGDAAVFSFELSKTLSAGWGGLVLCQRPGLGDRLRALRAEVGRLSRLSAARRLFQAGLSGLLYRPAVFPVTKYLVALLFRAGVFRPSGSPGEAIGELAPAAALAGDDAHWRVIADQLSGLDEGGRKSAWIAARYREVLRQYGWPGDPAERDPGIRLIRFPVLVVDPRRWVASFAKHGFELGRWFDAPISPVPADPAAFHFSPRQCPVAERVGRHMVNLPLHSRLGPRDVDRICHVLNDLLASLPDDERFLGNGG